jgi:hypothetical protein
MNRSISSWVIVWLLPVAAALAAAQREEAVMLFDNRKVVVAVPPGFSFASQKDEEGLVQLTLAAAEGKLSLQILLIPDPDERSTQARTRKERMVELFNGYVEDSVEKGMRFEELEPRQGAGTYCVFTDAKLVGQESLPPNEFLNLTAGLKAWRGVLVVFRLFSNGTTSAEYRAALALLRNSVEERSAPWK